MTFFWHEEFVNRGGYFTDLYMKIVGKIIDLSDKSHEHRQPKVLNDMEKRQREIDLYIEHSKCGCGGTCPTCQHLIRDVVADL